MPERQTQGRGVENDLVLIPGLLNDGDLWSDQIAALSPRLRCHVADITRGRTLGELAQDVLFDAPDRFALAGFSLGGFVAQEIMRVAPHRVTRLALLDTSISMDDPERAAMRRGLDKVAQESGKFHGFGRKLLTTYLAPENQTDARIVARIRAMTERLGVEVFIRQNGLQRKDGRAVLRALECPTLILCGERDVLTPLADHEEMAALAPHSTMVVVANSGHMTPLENPQAVTAALLSWLGLSESR